MGCNTGCTGFVCKGVSDGSAKLGRLTATVALQLSHTFQKSLNRAGLGTLGLFVPFSGCARMANMNWRGRSGHLLYVL